MFAERKVKAEEHACCGKGIAYYTHPCLQWKKANIWAEKSGIPPLPPIYSLVRKEAHASLKLQPRQVLKIETVIVKGKPDTLHPGNKKRILRTRF